MRKKAKCGSVLWLLLTVAALAGCNLVSSPPNAVFTYAPTALYPFINVTFDASSSTSGGNGSLAGFEWSFGDGGVAAGEQASHAFASAGRYTVTLTVLTSGGSRAEVQRTIDVLPGLIVPFAYSTIGAAIDAAVDGDVVVVMPGVYAESIGFKGKAITIRSTDPDDPTVVASTIITGGDPGRSVVVIGSNEARDSVLAGFTIRGGQEYPPCPSCGGGLYIREASPKILNNHFEGHTTSAAHLIDSGTLFMGNTFKNNSNDEPGGAIVVETYRVSPVIIGNRFENNTAPDGGAIYITSLSTENTPANAAATLVTDNTFVGNAASTFGGGAIRVEYGGNLRLDVPDSNSYSGNTPLDITYAVPP